jgi:glycosyltransferase involved in cell wall biosynthesis
MRKYIFLTCIPTPYRTSFYNELNKYDFNFEVYYMRETEADRSWKVDRNELKHSFFIDRGFYRMFGRYHVHFDPLLIIKIMRAKGSEIIIGGGWNDPDVLILVLLKRMGFIKNQLHFWTEANYLTIGARNDNVFKKIVRKFVYNSTKGAQLSSGRMTELTLEKWGVKVNRYIPLPNTIEEEKFKIEEEELVARYQTNIPTFLLPIRLHEIVKGMINFFSSIGAENIRKGLFLIAGDGPDRQAVEAFIHSHCVEDHIKLLGYCDTEELVSLYKKSNVFVLPSFTDASPLALIEALKMKLPVLVSDRCGNHFEAVVNERNGYLFDPSEPDAIKLAFEKLLLRANDWKHMGELSFELYEKYFNKNMVIEKFVQKLTAYSNSQE